MTVDESLDGLKSDIDGACALIDRLRVRLKGIADIIEAVDRRCSATDGPVSSTKEEITAEEIRAIYVLASRPYERKRIQGFKA